MESKGYFRALTSLKGLFILLIAVHNTLSVTPLFSGVPGVPFVILFGGKLGNSMFFILSGFLLSAAYKDRIRERRVLFGDYLLRRLKKLYPMYILSNLAAFVIAFTRYGVSAIHVEKMIFTVLLQEGGGIGSNGPYNSPTWFLSALFVCYILFFGICYFSKTSTQYRISVTVAVIGGYILLTQDPALPFLRAENGIACMNFFLGCIFSEGYPLISEKQHRWLQPLVLVSVPLLLGLMLSFGVEIIAGDVNVCFGFVLCPMILYLALSKGPVARILEQKCLVALGKISSSIFFWHLVIYFAFCDLWTCVCGRTAVQEKQYLLYFVLMVAISAVFSKVEARRSVCKRNGISV